MKSTLTRAIVATALISAASGAFAHEDYSEGGATHWLEHVQASPSQPTERQLAPYGYAATGAPERAVVIDSNSRYLNVVQLETVAIRMGGKTVNWTFDAFPGRSFPLSKIIPGADDVTVYVEVNPMWRGGR